MATEQAKLLMKCWNEDIFDDSIPQSMKAIFTHIVSKYKSRSKCLYNFDDLMGESLVATWDGLKDFRLICKECDERFETSQEFAEHTVRQHSMIQKAKVSITTYIYYRINARLQKLIGHEKRRLPYNTELHSLDNVGQDFNYYKTVGTNDSNFNEVDVIDMIEKAIEHFKGVELLIISLMLEGEETETSIAKRIMPILKKKRSMARYVVKNTLAKFQRRLNLLSA